MNEEVERGLRLKNPGYVYILKSGNTIKIGQSIKPQDRLEYLNRNSYCGRSNWKFVEAFETDWMLQVEQYTHMELNRHNVRRETFNCSIRQARETIISSISVFNRRFKNG